MSDLIFRISQNIVLGSYTISRLPQNVKVWGSRFMIVMDPVLKEVGLQDKVLQPLLERKIEYFIYENITDGANTKEIEQALMLAQQGRVHGIIAAGGSKALHLGAAVAALYNENHSVYDYMDGAVVFMYEPSRIYESVKSYAWQQSEEIKSLFEDGALCRGLDKFAYSANER